MTKDDLPSDFQEGALILIDKPLKWTSFDVVNKLRYSLKKQLGLKKIKVGHAGTLDPLATGLLLLCTGKFTKKLHELQGLSKVYTGQLTLGASTPSYDAETEPDFEASYNEKLGLEEIQTCVDAQFLGEIEQFPPVFSAIKVDGKPLYERARKGEQIDVPARRVLIEEFCITAVDLPRVEFRVRCSKGTYIRSLAHDLGKALGSAAYLSELRRTCIGDYKIEDAWPLETLIETIQELPPRT